MHSATASKLILSQSLGVTTKCAMCSFSPQKINRGHSPHLGTAMQTPFSPLSFDKSFMKIRSAVPENGWYFCGGRKKTKKAKKNKKTSVKHIGYAFAPPSGEWGCVKYESDRSTWVHGLDHDACVKYHCDFLFFTPRTLRF